MAAGEREKYAEIATERLAPLLLKLHNPTEQPVDDGEVGWPQLRRSLMHGILQMAGGLAVMPMMSSEFTGGFTADQLRQYRSRWQALREDAQDDLQRLAIDLIMLALVKQLGEDGLRDVIEDRIKNNPRLGDWPFGDAANVDAFIDELSNSQTLRSQ